MPQFEIPDINFSFPLQAHSELIFTITGIVLLLFGWLIFRAGTRLLGVGLGAGFGFFIGEVLNVILKVDRDAGLYITIACSFIGGLGALIMIRAVSNFLFALIGFLFGALLGRLGAEIYSNMHHIPFTLSTETGVIILASAGVTAIMAIWLQRLIMILITSYMGTTFLVAGVPYLAARPWSFIAVIIAGVLWQGYVLGRIFRRRPAAEAIRKVRRNNRETSDNP